MTFDLNILAVEIEQCIIDEWVRSGRSVDGEFPTLMHHEITQDGMDSIIWIYDGTEGAYGIIQNEGVAADKIPFIPNSERKARGMERSGFKTSKYIQGLVNYVKKKMGASDKDALSIAFSIAHKQRAVGMPIHDKEKKTHFVERAEPNIIKTVEEYLQRQLEIAI